jgi:hypothetical protein
MHFPQQTQQRGDCFQENLSELQHENVLELLEKQQAIHFA